MSEPKASDDLVERLQNWNHGIPKTMIVSEAIDEILSLRAKLAAAETESTSSKQYADQMVVERDYFQAQLQVARKALEDIAEKDFSWAATHRVYGTGAILAKLALRSLQSQGGGNG